MAVAEADGRDMGIFKNLKAVKDQMAAGAGGTELSEEVLALLTPEQRAAYEAQMGAVAGPTATASSSTAEAEPAASQVLKGPVGDVGNGPSPSGPVDRTTQVASERAARDQARTSYLAPDRAEVTFTRLATRGKTQTDEVAAYLASSGLASCPELLYGVYRVPDRIDPSSGGSEKGRVVEWDIVHVASQSATPTKATPHSSYFDGSEHWVARAPGEPSVLDEDLALAFLARAGVGPEHCLGIARQLEINNVGGDEASPGLALSQVTGVRVFLPAGTPSAAFDEMRAQRPVVLETGAPPGVHVEVMNWGDVAAAVHPEPQRAYAVPSPLPHLPSTAQELLRGYLEIVGVQPADCYSAQVTEDEPRDIRGSHAGPGGLGIIRSNRGDKLPCADGKDRQRLAGGTRVVVAYRDRPDYVAGRQRWDAYQRDVLRAELANGNRSRRPVEEPDFLDQPGGGRKWLRMAERVADAVGTEAGNPLEEIAHHRYCWPPVARG